MKLLLILFSVIGTSPFFADAMHGGKNTTIEQLPYIVQLVNNYKTGSKGYCGGAILSEYWVITAGHCILNEKDLLSRQVRVGATTTFGKDGKLYNVSKYITHKRYSTRTLWNGDISLIKLSEPIKYNGKSQPISISRDSPKNGSLITVSGYGRDHGIAQTNLKMGNQTVISQRSCIKAFEKTPQRNVTINNRVFCSDSTILDLGNGDSGGPAVFNGKLVGIASDGNESPLPDIFVNVAHYYDWIVNVTGIQFDKNVTIVNGACGVNLSPISGVLTSIFLIYIYYN